MRDRDQILTTLENTYREAFQKADRAGDEAAKERLDFEFQRDQVWLEVALDVRELLAAGPPDEEERRSLIDKAKALRDLTRLR